MATDWTYDPDTHQFVNESGRALTAAELVAVRDGFLAARSEEARVLARRYLAGNLTLDEWARLFKHETAVTHAAMFQLGSGGNERMMGLSTWGQRLQTMLDRQVPYADGFIRDVRAGLVSEAQMPERAAAYMGSAVESYERANADDWEIDLPYFPGQDTDCYYNCRCAWDIETVIEDEDEVTYATWVTEGDDKVCDVCQSRGDEWDHVEVRRSRLTDEAREAIER